MPHYINIHTHHPEPDTLSLLNIRLQGANPPLPEQGYFSAGIHPWDACEAETEWLDFFQAEQADHPGLLAIGEIGLDYRPAYQPYEKQEKWLKEQIILANTLRKPLIIHNVQATNALMNILRDYADTSVILHGFTGGTALAKQWLRQIPMVRFSFGPTFLKSPKTQEAFRFIATSVPSSFFLETDDEPTLDIRKMYIFAAGVLNWEISDLQNRIALNFNILFPQINFG